MACLDMAGTTVAGDGTVLEAFAAAVGSLPEANSYLALFDYNVGTLAQALSAASN